MTIIITTVISIIIILLLLLLVLLLSSILLLLLFFPPLVTTTFLRFLLRDHQENKAFFTTKVCHNCFSILFLLVFNLHSINLYNKNNFYQFFAFDNVSFFENGEI